MRDFLNFILDFIAASSLTDEEFDALTVTSPVYSLEVYTALLGVLDDRESVSSTRDRLRYIFMAGGVAIEVSSAGKSNIFLGSSLCS